jgi:hypothetical protein
MLQKQIPTNNLNGLLDRNSTSYSLTIVIAQPLSSGRLHKKLVTGSPFFAYRTHT